MIVLAQQSGFKAGFDMALEQAALILPKVGYFLLILIIGYFLAKVIEKILKKVLQKVGFDQLVERGGVKKAMAKSKYDAPGLLAKIVFYFIFLGVLSLAFSVFGPMNPISQFIAAIIAFLPSLFVAILALVIAAAIAAAVKDLVSNALGGLSYGNMLANVASLFIIGVGVFFALGELGIAPLIVGGVFYAILALVVIPPIIAFGVGGIEPAREAIRNAQDKAQDKAQEARQEMQSSGDDEDQYDNNDQYDDDQYDDEAPRAPARRPRTTARTATTRVSPRRRPTA